MKQLLFLFLLLAVPKCGYAQTAKALWCSGNSTLYFTYDTNTYVAGDTYDGQTITNAYSVSSAGYSSETSVPWYSLRASINKVTVASNFFNFKPTSLAYWFVNCGKLTTIAGLNYINTSNVTNMGYTFSGCGSLTSLDGLENWNTSNVTTLSSTFASCSSLTSLEPLRNWNTSSVTNMVQTFSGCRGLTSLDPLRNWDTSIVTDMLSTFSSCFNLTSLDGLENWNTSKVTNMPSTFINCLNLTSLDGLENWNTSSVTNMVQTFSGCRGLTSLEPLKNWNTSKVTTLYSTFGSCSSLTSLGPLRNWNTSSVTNMNSTFSYCEGLTSLEPLRNWNTSSVTYMNSTFFGCRSLTEVYLNWDAHKVVEMKSPFGSCTNLKGISFGENFTMNNVSATNSMYMFYGCRKLRYINFYESTYSTSGYQRPLNSVNRSSNTFIGVPETCVIYLPKRNGVVTDVTNVVYSYNGDGNDLRCPNYYSEDKVDIEFPRDFKTNRAEYSRTMSNTYGSVILPYAFTTNANIQAYTLDDEHPETMYFRDTETVPAHTPFAFKKLGNAEFIMEDATGGFGITVEATRSTNAGEDTWTGSKGTPYTHSENLGGWTTKGYYVSETVDDFDGTFYIAGDKFYKADGALTMYPHRVTFHGTWTKGTPSQDNNGAKFFNIAMGESEVITAIEEAALRKAEREAESIHDMQGRKVSSLQRGLNIVRMSDGTVRKLLRR